MSPRSTSRAWIIGISAAVVVALGTVILTGTMRDAASASDPVAAKAATTAQLTTIRETITDAKCGSAWSAPKGGNITFHFVSGFTAGDVYLEDPSSRKVYLELDGFGGNGVVDETVTLGNGSYRFECFPEDHDPLVGPTTTIAHAPKLKNTTPGVVPVTINDITPAVIAYQKWVEGRLPTLQSQVATLRHAAAAGHIAEARKDWITAHMTYETLGAAYDAFGDADAAINGTPASGKTAANDPDLTGFHKVESLLWSAAPRPGLVSQIDVLRDAISDLQKQFATTNLTPDMLPLRAHEIIENAVQFELTGQTDAGSHTELATISANLIGAQKTLELMKPLLTTRYSGLGQAEKTLAATKKLVARYHVDGRWKPLDSLTTAQREHLNAGMSELAERLAPVAAIGDLRNEIAG